MLFLTDEGDVLVVGDIAANHAAEMGRLELTVDHEAAEGLEHTGQMDKGQLGGTGHQREHALAKETPAEVDARKTTHKPIAIRLFLPHLDTCGKALMMEFSIGLDDIRTKPGALFRIAVLGGSTPTDDTIEILIKGEQVAVLFDELLHGRADMDLVGEDDETLQGTIPQGFLAMTEREPGEKAIGIGQQQTIDGEVASHSHQSVVFAQLGIRKPKFIV